MSRAAHPKDQELLARIDAALAAYEHWVATQRP
jgi:hypothetical protein